ncbi:hypothetical protein VNO78_10662 [Psophocarpus tetragonolobus]|uniref:Uncharacterized protein n=1 Tax=Psophocarpus tetragonolobus TaxID=3891 RepID=A0AAN9SK50_PSOTE
MTKQSSPRPPDGHSTFSSKQAFSLAKSVLAAFASFNNITPTIFYHTKNGGKAVGFCTSPLHRFQNDQLLCSHGLQLLPTRQLYPQLDAESLSFLRVKVVVMRNANTNFGSKLL